MTRPEGRVCFSGLPEDFPSFLASLFFLSFLSSFLSFLPSGEPTSLVTSLIVVVTATASPVSFFSFLLSFFFCFFDSSPPVEGTSSSIASAERLRDLSAPFPEGLGKSESKSRRTRYDSLLCIIIFTIILKAKAGFFDLHIGTNLLKANAVLTFRRLVIIGVIHIMFHVLVLLADEVAHEMDLTGGSA